MRKKILLSLLALVFLFVVTGCGNKDTENDNTGDNTNNTNVVEDNTQTSSDTEWNLFSDDSKTVFENTNTKYVFYHTGETITAYHTYVDYNDAATAAAAYAVFQQQGVEDADKVYLQGRYVVFEWNKSTYEDMTTSTLKLAYSYMKELKKN